ncbi:MAG: DUF4296 domain-containing protein [Flavobacterium sp.]
MKKIIVLLSILIMGSCVNKAETPQPAKPIDKPTMENILYDLAILQALKSYSPEKLTKNDINSRTYIYQKYNIDSLQFAENNKYYASDFTEYQAMFGRVTDRLQKQKAEIDNIIKKENIVKNKKRLDSIAAIAKKTTASKVTPKV